MIGLLQRVCRAHVQIAEIDVAAIEKGVLVLIGIERTDGAVQAQQLLKKLLAYRVFTDNAGKMNLSVADIRGGLLLVPQFTLVADTAKGLRPSFTPAAAPAQARACFEQLVAFAHTQYPHVQTGQFGADMQVHSVNDGPVTLWLRSR